MSKINKIIAPHGGGDVTVETGTTAGIIGSVETTTRDTVAFSIAEAIATRIQPTGLAAVMERLTAVDEDAMVIWTTKGPKGSHVVTVSEVLTEISGVKRSLIVKVYASGKTKMFIDKLT